MGCWKLRESRGGARAQRVQSIDWFRQAPREGCRRPASRSRMSLVREGEDQYEVVGERPLARTDTAVQKAGAKPHALLRRCLKKDAIDDSTVRMKMDDAGVWAAPLGGCAGDVPPREARERKRRFWHASQEPSAGHLRAQLRADVPTQPRIGVRVAHELDVGLDPEPGTAPATDKGRIFKIRLKTAGKLHFRSGRAGAKRTRRPAAGAFVQPCIQLCDAAA